MIARDDFSPATKRALAQRAAFRCSRPECRAQTSGPSETTASGGSSVGVAAHVTAAAPGGGRYNPALTPEQRQSIENGVWLCQNDAKLVDDDTRRFNADLLRAWRIAAERLASDEHGRPQGNPSMSPRVLAPFERELGSEPEQLRIDIHEFLADVGVTVVWAPYAIPVFMMLFELAINALRHGGAEHLRLASTEGVVTILDDGRAFGLAELRTGGRGAHLALGHLEAVAAGSITVRYQRAGRDNAWSLVDELLALGANTPCSLAPSGPGAAIFKQARTRLLALEDCEEIHLYPPALWSISDWFELAAHLGAGIGERVLIVHGIDPAARWVVKRAFPNARVVD